MAVSSFPSRDDFLADVDDPRSGPVEATMLQRLKTFPPQHARPGRYKIAASSNSSFGRTAEAQLIAPDVPRLALCMRSMNEHMCDIC